jgi:hypothetical protein
LTAQNRKLKQIVLDIGGTEFQAQLREWALNDETDDPETFFVYEPGEEFVEVPDPAYTLECTFYADWRSGGISDWLWTHRGEQVAFELTHHPDIPAEAKIFSGQLLVKAPSVGGEVRTTEESSVTFPIVGDIVYAAA